eukprot:scaffold486_cov254-Pinguiococcus_pyrenoidosus.AAC.11
MEGRSESAGRDHRGIQAGGLPMRALAAAGVVPKVDACGRTYSCNGVLPGWMSGFVAVLWSCAAKSASSWPPLSRVMRWTAVPSPDPRRTSGGVSIVR